MVAYMFGTDLWDNSGTTEESSDEFALTDWERSEAGRPCLELQFGAENP